MTLLGGVLSVKGMAFLMFSILIVTALGYMLGRITIKGVSLGTAGVFIVALLYGALFYEDLVAVLKTPELTSQSLKVVEQLGLIFFVTAVGFIAGPKFFKNLKKNFKSYILLGLIIILSGGLVTVGCYYFGITTGLGLNGLENGKAEFMAMLDGLLSGALTTTPGFSAAKETANNLYPGNAAYEAAITVGHGIAYLFGVVGVVLFFVILVKIPQGKWAFDWVKYNVPLFGPIIAKTAVSRFSRTLGTLMSSGVPVLNALAIVKETSGNEVVAGAIQKVHDAVKEGEGIAPPLGKTKVFEEMVVSMVEVGEDTGKLPEMLTKIADTYEDEVDNAVGALTSMIEPLMIVLLAGIVGTIVIALFMPLVKIIEKMS